MKTILVYPVPFNVWQTYRFYFMRFIQSFKNHPPGCEYELWLTCHWGQPTDEMREFCYDTKHVFCGYNGDGCQIGAQQYAAKTIQESNVFMVGLTSHAFFFRAGWLARLVSVREQMGPGLYGVARSREGGNLHLRTSCYGIDTDILNKYPMFCDTRADCTLFEHGPMNLTLWYEQQAGTPAAVVYWDSVVPSNQPGIVNGYRDGNQEQMLVWDRHTEIYAVASAEEKVKLAAALEPH